jgi:chromate transporter
MSPLAELARLFLKLGAIAFGGPAAHIAMMHREVVERRGWLTPQEFLDLVSAAHLIPGPNSTELAIHIGRRRAGWPGLLAAGVCFILPAALIVTACAWSYTRYGALPQVAGLLAGVKPVIIAIVLVAVRDLAPAALRSPLALAVAVVAFALALAGVHELLILLLAGLAGLARRATLAAAPFGLWPLFWFFAKVGSVLYGSGYVLLAFLRGDLVERWGWLSESQLLDAIAVGQFTPGPLFTTATFIGFLLAGAPGAAVATIGIFLPAFVFVSLSAPLLPRLRQSPAAACVLDAVNAASVALMAAVTLELGRSVLLDGPGLLLLLLSGALLLRYRINSAWLVAGGAVIGFLWHP